MLGSTPDPEQLIQQARAGDGPALNRLLRLYRNYLHLMARGQINGQLRLRIDPSDLTQEVMLVACQKFDQFRGTSEAEITSWLRRILVRKLADIAKRHRAKRRDIRREVTWEAALARSSLCAEQALVDSFGGPSTQARHREQSVLLADALARLPDSYREVLIMRHFERLNYEQIAARMGRSQDAIRQLWARAIERIRQDKQVEHDE